MSSDFASCCCVRCRAARSSCSGISLRSSSARRRASARASGDSCARSSLNFVVFGIVFFLHLGKVVVVNLIGQRHVLLVPLVVASLVTAQEQKRHAARIENVKHPVGLALVLYMEFTHCRVTRSFYSAALREWELWATFFQQQNRSPDRDSLGFTEFAPPGFDSSVTSTSHATPKL